MATSANSKALSTRKQECRLKSDSQGIPNFACISITNQCQSKPVKFSLCNPKYQQSRVIDHSLVDDELLDLLRKYLVQDCQHLVPKLHLLVSEASRHIVHTLAVDGWVSRPLEVAVGTAVGFISCVHLYLSFGHLNLIGVQDVEDSEGIVDGRVGYFVVIEIHNFELLKHVVDCFREGNIFVPVEMVEDLLRCHILVSDLQRNHVERNVAFQPEQLVESMSVEEDIELGCWRDVPSPQRTSHNHYLRYLLFYVRIGEQQNAEICERSCIGPDNLTRVSFYLMVDLLKDLLSDGSLGRSGQFHSSQSIAAMHVFGQLHLSLQKQVRSSIDRNVLTADVVQNIQGVLCSVAEIGVSG